MNSGINRTELLDTVRREGVVAILRLDDPEPVGKIIQALQEGGVHAIEITMGTPKALKLLETLIGLHPQALLGVGSVTDATTARAAIAAGARFLVTPLTKRSVIRTARRYDIPIFSGAFTPAEMLEAYEEGADFIKLFPADSVGISYLKAVRSPMPQLPIMPTGGITVENAADWIGAGAVAVGIGSALVDIELVNAGNYIGLTQRAKLLRERVDKALLSRLGTHSLYPMSTR